MARPRNLQPATSAQTASSLSSMATTSNTGRRSMLLRRNHEQNTRICDLRLREEPALGLVIFRNRGKARQAGWLCGLPGLRENLQGRGQERGGLMTFQIFCRLGYGARERDVAYLRNILSVARPSSEIKVILRKHPKTINKITYKPFLNDTLKHYVFSMLLHNRSEAQIERTIVLKLQHSIILDALGEKTVRKRIRSTIRYVKCKGMI